MDRFCVVSYLGVLAVVHSPQCFLVLVYNISIKNKCVMAYYSGESSLCTIRSWGPLPESAFVGEA